MISILIPVYNARQYIPDMIACLRAQTVDPFSFEAVFVNDGSTDDSLALLHSAVQSCAFRTRLIDQPNGGVSAARNAALRAAQGEYVAFADIDDLLAPDYVETLARFSALQADAVRFAFTRVDENAHALPAGAAGANAAPADKEQLLCLFLADPKLFGPYGFLFRRDFLLERGLCFAQGRPYYEDYDFILRAVASAKSLASAPCVLYAYRQVSGSAMMRYSAQRVLCLSLADETCSFLREQQCAAAPKFEKWYKARLYWAALWQACLALPRASDARRFLRQTGGRALLANLADYPGAKVALTALLARVCPALFALLARLLGGSHSLLRRMSAAEADALFDALGPS